jgi:hypothetical protein
MNVFAANKRVTLAKPLTNSGESASAHFCTLRSHDLASRVDKGPNGAIMQLLFSIIGLILVVELWLS